MWSLRDLVKQILLAESGWRIHPLTRPLAQLGIPSDSDPLAARRAKSEGLYDQRQRQKKGADRQDIPRFPGSANGSVVRLAAFCFANGEVMLESGTLTGLPKRAWKLSKRA